MGPSKPLTTLRDTGHLHGDHCGARVSLSQGVGLLCSASSLAPVELVPSWIYCLARPLQAGHVLSPLHAVRLGGFQFSLHCGLEGAFLGTWQECRHLEEGTRLREPQALTFPAALFFTASAPISTDCQRMRVLFPHIFPVLGISDLFLSIYHWDQTMHSPPLSVVSVT